MHSLVFLEKHVLAKAGLHGPPYPWEIQKVSLEISFTVSDSNSYAKIAILGNLYGGALPGLLGLAFLEKNSVFCLEGQ